MQIDCKYFIEKKKIYKKKHYLNFPINTIGGKEREKHNNVVCKREGLQKTATTMTKEQQWACELKYESNQKPPAAKTGCRCFWDDSDLNSKAAIITTVL